GSQIYEQAVSRALAEDIDRSEQLDEWFGLSQQLTLNLWIARLVNQTGRACHNRLLVRGTDADCGRKIAREVQGFRGAARLQNKLTWGSASDPYQCARNDAVDFELLQQRRMLIRNAFHNKSPLLIKI